ncbi:MAG: ParB/RepB/Spo0J family partition protein [Clostridia bacterium]|nr:ParB/RepB/Spo0J family partition protein [Clostridia bacterium]
MKITEINITELHLFRENPFKVRKDDAFDSLIESISIDGIYEPLIVCPDKDEGGYIIVSGQRRFEAAKTAGLKTVPAVVHDMDKDKMIIAIVDNNICSRDILPSEKAFGYKLKMEALSHQGTSRQVGEKWSVSQISEASNDSERQIHRYIRLTNLILELLNLIDEGKIAFSVGVELSYLDEEKQYVLLGLIEELDCTPSYAQANRMHKNFLSGMLSDDSIAEMMSTDKPNQRPVYKVSAERLSQFIKPDTSPKQAEEFIIKACDHYAKFLKRQRNRDAR